MKITLSKEELLAIVSNALNQNVTEVVISKPKNPKNIHLKILEEMKSVIPFIHMETVVFNDKKIAAIKQLREVSQKLKLVKNGDCLGLAQAKFAIENWPSWIGYVKENGNLPPDQFYVAYVYR